MYKITYTYTLNKGEGNFTKGTLKHIEEQMDDDILFLDFLKDLVVDAVDLYHRRLEMFLEHGYPQLPDSGKNIIQLSDHAENNTIN